MAWAGARQCVVAKCALPSTLLAVLHVTAASEVVLELLHVCQKGCAAASWLCDYGLHHDTKWRAACVFVRHNMLAASAAS